MHTVTNHQKDKHFTEHNSYLDHGMCTSNCITAQGNSDTFYYGVCFKNVVIS